MHRHAPLVFLAMLPTCHHAYLAMSTSELNVPGIILDKGNHQWIDHPPIYHSKMEKLPSEVPPPARGYHVHHMPPQLSNSRTGAFELWFEKPTPLRHSSSPELLISGRIPPPSSEMRRSDINFEVSVHAPPRPSNSRKRAFKLWNSKSAPPSNSLKPDLSNVAEISSIGAARHRHMSTTLRRALPYASMCTSAPSTLRHVAGTRHLVPCVASPHQP